MLRSDEAAAKAALVNQVIHVNLDVRVGYSPEALLRLRSKALGEIQRSGFSRMAQDYLAGLVEGLCCHFLECLELFQLRRQGLQAYEDCHISEMCNILRRVAQKQLERPDQRTRKRPPEPWRPLCGSQRKQSVGLLGVR
jgi:hypothetical protein